MTKTLENNFSLKEYVYILFKEDRMFQNVYFPERFPSHLNSPLKSPTKK